VGALSVAALVVGAAFLAAAWRDGPADFQCKCTCDREGNSISLEEARAREDSYEDRTGLLFRGFASACVGGAISLVGLLVGAARRVGSRSLVSLGALVAIAAALIGVAFVSLPPLVPCFGE
jgi:hypothetical protein